MRVQCRTCGKIMLAWRWLRHERRKHGGFAPYALITRRTR
jgi:hypothetical protein